MRAVLQFSKQNPRYVMGIFSALWAVSILLYWAIHPQTRDQFREFNQATYQMFRHVVFNDGPVKQRVSGQLKAVKKHDDHHLELRLTSVDKPFLYDARQMPSRCNTDCAYKLAKTLLNQTVVFNELRIRSQGYLVVGAVDLNGESFLYGERRFFTKEERQEILWALTIILVIFLAWLAAWFLGVRKRRKYRLPVRHK